MSPSKFFALGVYPPITNSCPWLTRILRQAPDRWPAVSIVNERLQGTFEQLQPFREKAAVPARPVLVEQWAQVTRRVEA